MRVSIDEAAAVFVEGDSVHSGVEPSGSGQRDAESCVPEPHAAELLAFVVFASVVPDSDACAPAVPALAPMEGAARGPRFAGHQRSGGEDEASSPTDYYSSAQVGSRSVSGSVPGEYGR